MKERRSCLVAVSNVVSNCCGKKEIWRVPFESWRTLNGCGLIFKEDHHPKPTESNCRSLWYDYIKFHRIKDISREFSRDCGQTIFHFNLVDDSFLVCKQSTYQKLIQKRSRECDLVISSPFSLPRLITSSSDIFCGQ